MRDNSIQVPGLCGGPSQSPRRPPQTFARSAARHALRGSRAARTSVSGASELTQAQQIEAKTARDAVVRAMTKSSPQVAKKFVESISFDIDVETARQLVCSKKGFVTLPSSIGILCRQLRKLDLSGNDITDLSPLATLQHLSNLNVAHNDRLASLKGLSGTCLSVLNISFCAVESLEGLEHTALTLRTLIANDNRLQLHAPLLGDVEAKAGEDALDIAAVREHLPESLRRSCSHNASAAQTVAQRNYFILSTFQQCETVVLSRNTRLCQLFPTWGVEEVAAECGEVPGCACAGPDDEGGDDEAHSTSTTIAADGGDDESASGDKKCRVLAGKRHNHRGTAVHPAGRPVSTTTAAACEPLGDSPEVVAYNQRRRALALAHPLSVFEKLSRLRKVSLSGCELHSLPVRWFLPMVTELRLAQNNLTSLQPDGVILRSLHILDISNNLFRSVESLRRCRFLEQLNLRGNPLIEEGALQDKAAGLTATEWIADAAVATSASGTSTVPITVQKHLLRLFPNMKLLDGQALMTAGQVRAAYMRRSARSTAEKQEKPMEKVSGGISKVLAGHLHKVSDDVSDGHTASIANEGDSASDEAPSTVPMVGCKTRSPARKARRVDSTVIAAEADEKDVVVEPPLSVIKTAHAPIVRRERVLLRPGATAASETKVATAGQKRKGGNTSASPAAFIHGQAAVETLLKQSRSTSAW